MNRLFSAATALRVSLLAAAVLAPLAAASAQGLSLSLTTVGSSKPGTTLQYFGTLTNLLPSDNLYVADLGFEGEITDEHNPNFSKDDNPFFDNVAKYLTEDPDHADEYYMTPGQKVIFEVFGVTISANAKPGTTVEGAVNILGGGPGDTEPLVENSVPFTVTAAPIVTVPEAGTLALLLPALAVLGGAVVARRRIVAA